MAFGNGNRTCLGRPLALVKMYTTTAILFGKYKVGDIAAEYWCGIGVLTRFLE